MRRRWSLALGVIAPGLMGVGCASAPSAPERTAAPVAQAAPTTPSAPPAESVPVASATPVVALVEPYLVAVAEPKALVLPPPSLRGQILTPAPASPLSPSLPTETVPIAPPVEASPAPSTPSRTTAPSRPGPKGAKPTIPPGVVKLLEDERARSVDEARDRLAAASARVGQTAAEAKRQWGFVKEGFVAQKTADAADAAARQAVQEQAEAQKALDAAQQRQREARRDLQAAYGAVAATPDARPGFVEASLEKPLPAYRPVPFTYRLSILGEATGKPTVENGTLGRSLPAGRNERAVWLVRCADPSQLRIKFGAHEAMLVTHALPPAQPPQRGV